MKLLAISGSARKDSTNTAFLLAIRDLASADLEISVFHRLDLLPVFSPDSEGPNTPEVMEQFLKLLSDADGVIISSPEYVHSIPGGLKNAIDWMVSRFEVIEKPVVLAHASHRGDEMLVALRLVLRTVSKRFHEDVFLRVPLLGRSPQEISTLMRNGGNRREVDDFLRLLRTTIRG